MAVQYSIEIYNTPSSNRSGISAVPEVTVTAPVCLLSTTKTIDYFKLQAKNLHKDFKTQKRYFDSLLGGNFFEYAPKFFDVDARLNDFDIDENYFTLMNAQHIIAKLVGFEKWTEMLKASPPALELGKLLFGNMHKIRMKSGNIISWMWKMKTMKH